MDIAVFVERHFRSVMLVKVANKDTEIVVSALIKSSQKLPPKALQIPDLVLWQRAGSPSTPDYGG